MATTVYKVVGVRFPAGDSERQLVSAIAWGSMQLRYGKDRRTNWY